MIDAIEWPEVRCRACGEKIEGHFCIPVTGGTYHERCLLHEGTGTIRVREES